MAGNSKGWIAPVSIVVVALVVFAAWFVGKQNSLVTLEEGVNAAWSEIDNQLQRRSDLIPNLVATVRGYADHEEEVFTAIADARSRLAGATGVRETAESYGELEGALSRLLVISESYPQLRANENFVRLQDELAGTENRIAVARGRYNEQVREYNTRIRLFPDRIVAGRLGFEQRDYFEVSESAREAPQVDFGD